MTDNKPNTSQLTSPSTEQALAQAMHFLNIGKLKEAEKLVKEQYEKYSLEPQVLHAMGLVSYKKENFKGAIEQMEKAVQIDKKNPLFYGNLGEAYRRNKQLNKAMAAFEKALVIMPEFLKAHLGVANTFRDMKKYPEAISRYRLSLAINPQFAPAYHYLGLTFVELEKVNDAIPVLRKAVALRPGYMEAQLSLANTLEMTSQYEEALQIYNMLVEKLPNNIAIHNNMGNILRNLGRIDEAVEHYQKALTLDPDHVSAYYNLSRSRVGSDENELDRMEKMFKDPRLSVDQKCSLHFTLGKIYDDRGEYSKAFAHFHKGNELDTREKSFDAKQHSLVVDRIIATFSQEFFANRKGMGSESELPVIICGMPRSGTTLVEQTLASHPRVYGAGELNNIGQLIAKLPDIQGKLAGFPDSATLIDAITACKLGEEYVAFLKSVGGEAARVTDKMPGNFMNLGYIALFLTNVKIIHCARNPLDTCLSNYFQHFTQVLPFSRNLSDLGHYYRDYLRIMAHWRQVLSLPILDVHYEEMASNHEEMSRKIIEFVGLEWDDVCLDFHKTDRPVKTASNWQVRQPVYTSSVARWKNYDEFIGPLKKTLGDALPDESESGEEKSSRPRSSRTARPSSKN